MQHRSHPCTDNGPGFKHPGIFNQLLFIGNKDPVERKDYVNAQISGQLLHFVVRKGTVAVSLRPQVIQGRIAYNHLVKIFGIGKHIGQGFGRKFSAAVKCAQSCQIVFRFGNYRHIVYHGNRLHLYRQGDFRRTQLLERERLYGAAREQPADTYQET